MLFAPLAFTLAAALLPSSPMDRRAVLGGTVTAASLLVSPLPASARSKEKAKEKAMQKATAGEARQAMKEYKYAPRPELVGNAETGYKFKEGTVKEGSTGELASYFTDKGSNIQAEYAKRRALETGLSQAEAAKKAEEARKAVLASKKSNQKKELSADDLRIAQKAKEFEVRYGGSRPLALTTGRCHLSGWPNLVPVQGVVDDMGRRIF